MAAVSLPPGAQVNWAPFPEDTWYKVHVWELEDCVVSIYRKGNQFQYRLTDALLDQRDVLPYMGNPDEFFEYLQRSAPLRIGEMVRFVTPQSVNAQVPSRVDPNVMITHRMWGITLVSQTGSGANSEGRGPIERTGISCDALTLIFGHAYLHIEMLNDAGNRVERKAHIVTQFRNAANETEEIGNNRAMPLLDNHCITPANWPKTEVILKSADCIQRMLAYIRAQIAEDEEAVRNGLPRPIQFNGVSPNPEERIHNCLSWSFDVLAVAGIRIPMIEFPLPGATPWFVPRYHIRFLDKLCRRYIQEGKDIAHAIPPEGIEEIQEGERKVSKAKGALSGAMKDTVAMTCITALYPPMWFVAPIALPIVWISGGVRTAVNVHNVHKNKKALENRKVEYLVNYCKGE